MRLRRLCLENFMGVNACVEMDGATLAVSDDPCVVAAVNIAVRFALTGRLVNGSGRFMGRALVAAVGKNDARVVLEVESGGRTFMLSLRVSFIKPSSLHCDGDLTASGAVGSVLHAFWLAVGLNAALAEIVVLPGSWVLNHIDQVFAPSETDLRRFPGADRQETQGHATRLKVWAKERGIGLRERGAMEGVAQRAAEELEVLVRQRAGWEAELARLTPHTGRVTSSIGRELAGADIGHVSAALELLRAEYGPHEGDPAFAEIGERVRRGEAKLEMLERNERCAQLRGLLAGNVEESAFLSLLAGRLGALGRSVWPQLPDAAAVGRVMSGWLAPFGMEVVVVCPRGQRHKYGVLFGPRGRRLATHRHAGPHDEVLLGAAIAAPVAQAVGLPFLCADLHLLAPKTLGLLTERLAGLNVIATGCLSSSAFVDAGMTVVRVINK